MADFIFDFTITRGASLAKGIRYSKVLCKSSSAVTIALGSATFLVPTGLDVSNGQRIRASLVDTPVTDPTQYIEGTVTSYTGTALIIHVDTISGSALASFSSWLLTAPIDLTGGTFNAAMRFGDTCSGRGRAPVPLTIMVLGDPTVGIFEIYLSPAQTSALILGTFTYKVLFTPASSSDKFKVVGGTITVIDE